MKDKMKCNKRKSLLDVLQVINENGKGIAFIIDDNDRLCGVLTDGDIRSLLLAGHALQENIEGLFNTSFVYAKDTDDPQEVIAKTNEIIRVIPIVDKDFHYVDFFEYSHHLHVPVARPDLSGNELKYLVDAFLSTWISSTGHYIDKFEEDFARFCECKYGIAVANGTVALHLALLALGIGEKDEVIVPDLTFAATINAVLHAKATPVIVDVDRDSWCIDVKEIEKAITSRTKAIIPVHLYGQPCNMTAIMEIAKKHKFYVIEDCAEAHGARFDKKKVGSFGDIGCFSFYGNKIITTGEGGMCVTNSQELSARMRMLRDHGMSKTRKYWHDVVGYNYRMTNLQAAIGLAQLEKIDKILSQRKRIEEDYKMLMSDLGNIEFQKDDLAGREKITWLVCALVKDNNRDIYLNKLKDIKVDTRPFFSSLSSMPIYKNFVFSNKNSNEISKRGINLPTNIFVNKETIERIKNTLTHV